MIAQSNFDESKVVAASQSAFQGVDPGGGGGGGGRGRGQDPPFFCQTIIVNTVIKIMVCS